MKWHVEKKILMQAEMIIYYSDLGRLLRKLKKMDIRKLFLSRSIPRSYVAPPPFQSLTVWIIFFFYMYFKE